MRAILAALLGLFLATALGSIASAAAPEDPEGVNPICVNVAGMGAGLNCQHCHPVACFTCTIYVMGPFGMHLLGNSCLHL